MGPKQSQPTMDDFAFELKMNSKQLQREASKAKQDEAKYKTKVLACIKEGDRATAEIHAQSCIRCKQQALKMTRLGARMEAVAMQLKSAAVMQGTAQMMGQTAGMLSSAMASMDMEQLGRIMDKCEEQFEELEIKSRVMDDALGKQAITGASSQSVGQMMTEIAEEAKIDLATALPGVGVGDASTISEEKKAVMPPMPEFE
ncbi:Snf7 family like protein [Aduncisulcus paluster]|uniref:Snf7 family like protein n=1 Tax=Aduncisulcus paluster TaxID=2918883 RepID=A0ABQ5KPU6_9EUKA|nr:Snf7 family like protein [Aduncisulcus paluster]|eukprot:gnl/Carplike_NY0171/545_a746_2901.p1 GENE.gnl/Carplike_NY0171/545_a746_2901~~gnl/Carplike_NY0171/545_a746_2901.p1  ORF type:complete len:201 (+),score=63.24 gnl/Carplike_NY0171/545_a746_2901:1-603(+)